METRIYLLGFLRVLSELTTRNRLDNHPPPPAPRHTMSGVCRAVPGMQRALIMRLLIHEWIVSIQKLYSK